MAFTDGLGVSNTQPDYTATCVTFKQSGTTDVGIEGAPQLPNLARDCARQGYSPKWTSGDGQISLNSWLKDPNIKEAIAAIYSFPYLDKSTPATKRFNSVMKKYAPSVLKSDYKQPATTTWTAADRVREGGGEDHVGHADRGRRHERAQLLQQRDPRRVGAQPDHVHRRSAARPQLVLVQHGSEEPQAERAERDEDDLHAGELMHD